MDHLAHESVEQLAALILVIGGGIFIAIALRARLVRRGSVAPAASLGPAIGRSAAMPEVPSAGRSIDLILAGLSAGAAFIHLAAAPSHYDEIGDLAAGFLVSAAFQALWIRWVLAGPTTRTIVVGIVGNLAIVAAWAWTRTVGLPVGEFAGSPEPVGYPDAASVVFELLLVVGLVVRRLSAGRGPSPRPAMRTAASVAVVPAIGLVIVLTSLATVAIASGLDHGAPDGHPAAEHVATH